MAKSSSWLDEKKRWLSNTVFGHVLTLSSFQTISREQGQLGREQTKRKSDGLGERWDGKKEFERIESSQQATEIQGILDHKILVGNKVLQSHLSAQKSKSADVISFHGQVTQAQKIL